MQTWSCLGGQGRNVGVASVVLPKLDGGGPGVVWLLPACCSRRGKVSVASSSALAARKPSAPGWDAELGVKPSKLAQHRLQKVKKKWHGVPEGCSGISHRTVGKSLGPQARIVLRTDGNTWVSHRLQEIECILEGPMLFCPFVNDAFDMIQSSVDSTI